MENQSLRIAYMIDSFGILIEARLDWIRIDEARKGLFSVPYFHL